MKMFQQLAQDNRRLLMPFLRIKNGTSMMPTATLVNEAARTITLCGMKHIALASFYQAMGEAIRSLENGGAAVHHEGIRNDQPDQRHLGMFDALMAVHGHDFRRLGLVCQLDSFPISPSWENHDVTANTDACLERRPPPPCSDFAIRLNHQLLIQKFERIPFRNIVLSLESQDLALHRGQDEPDDLSACYRNRLATNAMLRTVATGRDMVAVWGAAHLAPIACRLGRNGFRVVHIEWRPAWVIQNRQLLEAT